MPFEQLPPGYEICRMCGKATKDPVAHRHGRSEEALKAVGYGRSEEALTAAESLGDGRKPDQASQLINVVNRQGPLTAATAQIRLTFEAPARVLSTNHTTSHHWREWHKDKKRWREAGFQLGTETNSLFWSAEPTDVQLSLPFGVSRKRDPHNFVGTVCKWFIDGMVMAEVWPDDTPEYVRVIEPGLRLDLSLEVVATLTRRLAL